MMSEVLAESVTGLKPKRKSVERKKTKNATTLRDVVNADLRVKGLRAEIEKAEQISGIKLLKEELKSATEEYDYLINAFVPTVDFSLDKFVSALKKRDTFSYREGDWKLVRSTRRTRTVVVDRFVRVFPDLLPSVCKIEVKKAESLVGAKTLEEFVDITETNSYEIVSMDCGDYGKGESF